MIKSIILHTITCEKRTIINNTIGLSVALLLIAFFNVIAVPNPEDPTKYLLVYGGAVAFISTVYLALIALIGSSRVFRCLRTRNQAISFLMLPASNLDKFLARILIGTVGYSLMFLVALIVADALQAIYHLSVHSTADSFIRIMFSDMDLTNDDSIRNLILFHSIFTLGASIFRKHAFIKTAAIVALVGMFLSGYLTYICSTLSPTEDEYLFLLINNPTTSQEVMILTLIFAFSALCYFLAYRRFCRWSIA